jgi:uncharacterized membrane protein
MAPEEEIVQLVTAALWVHLMATVALVGYYTVLAVVVLPALSGRTGPAGSVEIMAAIERRAMPVLVASLVAFLATGIYLTTGDARYSGPGNVNDAWSTLLLVKHVVIVGMLALGSLLDGLIVRSAALAPPGSDQAGRRIAYATRGMAILGATVLLLTAAAQTP